MTENTLPVGASRRKRRDDDQPPSRKRSALLFLRDLLVIFVIALLASFLIKTFLVRSFYIPSSSMENTLHINDRIIVNQLTPSIFPIEHGDVVVFKDPGGWLMPHAVPEQAPLEAAAEWVLSTLGLSAPDSNDHLIKRVIGLPGDHVVCCNALGQMSVNDVPLNEPYVKPQGGDTVASSFDFDVTVPAESLWVMGDNRNNSKDSRLNRETPGGGFVPIDNVVGRALVISWPIDRWTWLDNYGTVFGGVPAAVGTE